MHRDTQRHKANEDHVVYDEIIYTLDYIQEHVDVDPEKLKLTYKNVASWWGSSLFRQRLSRDYFRHNWRLYNYFRKRRPRLALNILSNSIFALVGGILDKLGIKKTIKKWRARMFPGKFFEY